MAAPGSRGARTIDEMLKSGKAVPADSLLAEAIRQNPTLETFSQTLTVEQEDLISAILLAPREPFGPRDRKGSYIRIGDELVRRLDRFLLAYPVNGLKQRLFEYGLDRLLKDLGG